MYRKLASDEIGLSSEYEMGEEEEKQIILSYFSLPMLNMEEIYEAMTIISEKIASYVLDDEFKQKVC